MEKIISYNPATGKILGEVAVSLEADVQNAVEKAKAQSSYWANLSFNERKKYMLAFRDAVMDEMDSLVQLISEENGKPQLEALGHDIIPALDFVHYFAHKTESLLKNENLCLGKWSLLGKKSHLEYYPYGVVGIISPWNFPFSIPVGQIVMALMAGNVVILKPSEFTPLVTNKIMTLFKKVGLPEGVLQIVHGQGDVGALLVSRQVDKISFTGSVATGKKIMASCAQTLKSVTLELGGKDPLIVFEDADLDVASSATVWGAFCNSGQVCASVERVYVQQSVAQDFIDRVVRKTKSLRQGDGLSFDVDLGSMTAKMQIDKVISQVEKAKARGAVVLTGGEPKQGEGYFYPPTILTHVDHTFDVVNEETFGPVLPIMTFTTEEEVINKANDSIYALNAYIWTKNIKRAEKVASRLVAGTVNINESVFSFAVPETPWGGPKSSGTGHTHGVLGLMDLVRVRHVHRNMMPFKKNFFWWYGYSEDKAIMLKTFALVLFGKSFARFKALVKLVKMALKAKVL